METTDLKSGYEKIQEYIRANPGTSKAKAAKAVGVHVSSYYNHLTKTGRRGSFRVKRAKKLNSSAPQPQTFVIPEETVTPGKNIVVMLVPTSEVRSTLIQLMG